MPIHPTAVVDARADIAPSAEIGPYVVIDGPVRIGAGTHIAPHVYLTGDTTIGAACRIHASAIIGDVPQDRAFAGGPSSVVIGDETIIRECVTVHRGTKPGTVTQIGQRCMLMAHAHVAHNCTVGNDVVLVNGALLGGHVTVGQRAVISGNAAVHQWVRVGEMAMIGGLSKITQDIPPYLMFDGHGLCVGLNLVGLRRAGVAAADRAELKWAYRRLYRMTGSMAAALSDVDAALTTPTGRQFVEFLKTPSKRGVHAHASHEPTIPMPLPGQLPAAG